MGQKYYARARAATLASCVIAAFATASAVEPIVRWDGASKYCNFNTLTRTVGDNTYTLNLNPVGSANTVAADASYIQIANVDAQCGVTITTQNSDPAVTNGFGTSGTISVLMKCREMPVTAGSYRAIITLMDGKKYKYGGTTQQDNGAVLGMYINAGTSGWIWRGSTAGMAGLSGNFLNTVSGKFSADEQVVALTYSNSGGTCYYVNGELAQSESGLKDSAALASPYGIALGGLDVSTGSQFFALKNMKIEAIAVFTSTLTPEQVAAFSFSAQRATLRASEVNARFGDQKDITLELADGAVVDGDTTFYATNINFICNGSITVAPHQNDTTAFDFSRVTGNVTVEYKNALPSKSGDKFTATSVPTWVTNSSKWTGTVAFSDMTIIGPNFNDFGNEASAIRLSGVSGYLATGTDYTVPIILENGGYDFALKLKDGFSPQSKDYNSGDYVNLCAVFHKISGNGSIVDGIADNGKGAWPIIKVYDASGFTGNVSLDQAILLVCDSTTQYSPSLYEMFKTNANKYNTNGVVRIESSNSMSLPAGKTWSVNAVTFNGPVNFTTSEPITDGQVLFDCDGPVAKKGGASFTINGEPIERSLYKVKAVGTQLRTTKMHGKRVVFR